MTLLFPNATEDLRGPGHIATGVTYAAALGAVDAFFRHSVSEGLCKTALTQLARNESVDSVLEIVDLFVACDLGLVEVVCPPYVSAPKLFIGT